MTVEQNPDEPEPVVRLREIATKVQQAAEEETVSEELLSACRDAIDRLQPLGEAAWPAGTILVQLLEIFW